MLLPDSEYIAYADGVLLPKKQAMLEEIYTGLGAKKGALTAAQRLITRNSASAGGRGAVGQRFYRPSATLS